MVDTVGAGDAFTAGVLAHLTERRLLSSDALRTLDRPALEELLQAACIVAADTCTRAGAEPPRRHQLGIWTQERNRGRPMRAVRYTAPGHFQVVDVPPPVGPSDVRMSG